MSWLRGSPLRNSFGKQWARDSPPKDADPGACYDSFCKHWQQTHEIINQSCSSASGAVHDDVLAIVNHIDQMVTLLVVEFRQAINLNQQLTATPSHSPCLEHLLSENLLDLIYDWSTTIGRYTNVVRLEVIKMFEVMVAHNGSLLAHEPVARPLLRLLTSCAKDIMSPDMEKHLIVLLNGICVALMQNMALLDVFFHPNVERPHKFIIFTLLLPYIHREGTIGQQARDAMLLCMALSKKNPQIGEYIAKQSDCCLVLATGISGLYSLLPRKLDIDNDDWHRLTPDDVNDIPSLDNLMHSFEFCNVVAQIAHEEVQKQLLEYLYQGFLVPVLGPALMQTAVAELIATTAYFDLFVRSVTDPGLLKTLIKFLLVENYDESRLLDVFIQRISSRSRLCIVTLALFETLINLNCEDIMLELCLSSLAPCSHIMLSQRHRLRDFDMFGSTAKKFLSLRPSCCLSWTNSLPDTRDTDRERSILRTEGPQSIQTQQINMNFAAKMSDSLYGNYHAYLYDARQKIIACQLGCIKWSSKYSSGEVHENNLITNSSKRLNSNHMPINNLPTSDILESIKSFLDGDNEDSQSEELNFTLSGEALSEDHGFDHNILTSDIETLLNDDIDAGTSEGNDDLTNNDDSDVGGSMKVVDSIVSTGDSSGYESLAQKSPETGSPKLEDDSSKNVNGKIESVNPNDGPEMTNGRPDVGMFLDTVLKKLESMTSNNIYVNLHLTGLISRLAIYRQPLLQSFLLNPSLVFQPSIRSLFQILASLKHKFDQYLAKVDNVDELVRQARAFLINREYRLVNAREMAIKSMLIRKDDTPADTIIRNESKRRSLTTSLTQIFKFGANSSPPMSLRLVENQSAAPDDSNRRFVEMTVINKSITPTQHVVICAVIMDEWLKELAAITQEHVVLSFTSRMEF